MANDRDEAKIRHLRHNAGVYDVASRIETVKGDAYAVMGMFAQPVQEKEQSTANTKRQASRRADIVLLSPPWGGQGYTKVR